MLGFEFPDSHFSGVSSSTGAVTTTGAAVVNESEVLLPLPVQPDGYSSSDTK